MGRNDSKSIGRDPGHSAVVASSDGCVGRLRPDSSSSGPSASSRAIARALFDRRLGLLAWRPRSSTVAPRRSGILGLLERRRWASLQESAICLVEVSAPGRASSSRGRPVSSGTVRSSTSTPSASASACGMVAADADVGAVADDHVLQDREARVGVRCARRRRAGCRSARRRPAPSAGCRTPAASRRDDGTAAARRATSSSCCISLAAWPGPARSVGRSRSSSILPKSSDVASEFDRDERRQVALARAARRPRSATTRRRRRLGAGEQPVRRLQAVARPRGPVGTSQRSLPW